jgi:hypothetical protein
MSRLKTSKKSRPPLCAIRSLARTLAQQTDHDGRRKGIIVIDLMDL